VILAKRKNYTHFVDYLKSSDKCGAGNLKSTEVHLSERSNNGQLQENSKTGRHYPHWPIRFVHL